MSAVMGTAQSRQLPITLENYSRLLHREAKRSFARLKSAGVPIDYEDVYQEMCMAYCRAEKGYDPSLGFTFSTYLVNACRFEFNRAVEKSIEEKKNLGLTSINDLGGDSEDDSEPDYLLGLRDTDRGPEESLAHRQTVTQRINQICPEARRVLVCLMRPPQALLDLFKRHQEDQAARKVNLPGTRIPEEINFAFIGNFLRYDRKVMKKVKSDLDWLAEAAN